MEVFSLVFHLPLSFYNELNEVISRNKMKVRAIRIMTHIITLSPNSAMFVCMFVFIVIVFVLVFLFCVCLCAC